MRSTFHCSWNVLFIEHLFVYPSRYDAHDMLMDLLCYICDKASMRVNIRCWCLKMLLWKLEKHLKLVKVFHKKGRHANDQGNLSQEGKGSISSKRHLFSTSCPSALKSFILLNFSSFLIFLQLHFHSQRDDNNSLFYSYGLFVFIITFSCYVSRSCDLCLMSSLYKPEFIASFLTVFFFVLRRQLSFYCHWDKARRETSKLLSSEDKGHCWTKGSSGAWVAVSFVSFFFHKVFLVPQPL